MPSLIQEGHDSHLKGPCKSLYVVDRDISFSPFNRPHIGPVQSSQLAKLFLTQTIFKTDSA